MSEPDSSRPANGRRPRRRGKRKRSRSDSSSSGEEPQVLLAAAAAWASSDNDEDVAVAARPAPNINRQPKANGNCSVHVTQIPFKARQSDIHRHFSEQGCMITALRMVFDRQSNGQKQFRGVAFIDLVDEISRDAALKLHRSTLMGRAINVRRTRALDEIADIVKKRHETIETAKRQSKEKSSEAGKPQSEKQPNKKIKDDRRPLTKKERNRRAAIIRSRQQGARK